MFLDLTGTSYQLQYDIDLLNSTMKRALNESKSDKPALKKLAARVDQLDARGHERTVNISALATFGQLDKLHGQVKSSGEAHDLLLKEHLSMLENQRRRIRILEGKRDMG